MSLKPADAKALRAALKSRRSRAELKRLFGMVRRHDDRALLQAALPAKKKPRRAVDPLVRGVERTLKPVMAPVREKAELLVEHMAKKHRRKLTFEPKGLASAVRKLRGKFSDDQISAGANSLLNQLAQLYGDHDSVV
jgi:hypothetical protein